MTTENYINSTLENDDGFFDDSHDYQKEELNLVYAISEVLVASLAVVGNALVILVFRKERRLRRRTNYYIVSLAAADFLVGLLGIPFAIMSSVGLPTNLYACLFTVSLLVVLCTISIFCLVAVSVDRYWAILHPMGYSRNVRTKTALVIISICWFAGTLIGFLPLMGWHKGPAENGRCFFLGVMDYNYLVFLYFGTIITPALLLAVFYAHIYHVVLKQLRQIVTINPYNGSSRENNSRSTGGGGTMLRVLGAAQKREVKATQNLSIIVLFFMICWIPLYTINCILAFCRDCKVNSTFVLSCIILSHLNSAGNPLLYAYHLKDFRAALKAFICNIFGIKIQQQNAALNNNFTHYRLQSLREVHSHSASAISLTRSSRYVCESNLQMRSHTLPGSLALAHHSMSTGHINKMTKISSLVGNSVALAAATAQTVDGRNRLELRDGQHGGIWRISEISDENQRKSISSLDDECHTNSGNSANSNDDVFLPRIPHSPQENLSRPVSSSSTQLYLVEHGVGDHNLPNLPGFTTVVRRDAAAERKLENVTARKSRISDESGRNEEMLSRSNLSVSTGTGDFIHSPAKSVKLSPFKAVGGLLRTSNSITGNPSCPRAPPARSCSLSEENEGIRHRNNGYITENHSCN